MQRIMVTATLLLLITSIGCGGGVTVEEPENKVPAPSAGQGPTAPVVEGQKVGQQSTGTNKLRDRIK